MIKCETIGMFEVAKNNPVLTAETDTENYTFVTDNGDLYLIDTIVGGDDYYKRENTIPAGEFMRGFRVADWVGQKLVIDEKHIAYGSGETYASITAGTTLLTVNNNGKLAITADAPESGIYFKVLEKVQLTENAVKAVVVEA